MIVEDQVLENAVMMWLVSESNPTLRGRFQEQLITLSLKNKRFSREYFFAYFALKNRSIILLFIPGTPSYLDYGSQVIVEPFFTEEVAIDLRYNIENNISTHGLVSAKDSKMDMKQEARKRILISGFTTNHVMEIKYLDHL